MQRIRQIDRPNISDSVVIALREMIVDGRLKAGDRINEVHLSQRLGISRTPLREALIRLTAEGALASRPRSGFYVRPLSIEEFEQIYPIRAILDPEALRLAGSPPPERLLRLERSNRKLAETVDPEAILKLDDAWHLELLADCPNAVLLGLIKQFILRTRRYELALMRDRRNVEHTIRDHDDVLAALRKGDLEAACLALRRNMESGKAPIIAWLQQRQTD
jgi:DNA-binding GntR family transcriptional regulator